MKQCRSMILLQNSILHTTIVYNEHIVQNLPIIKSEMVNVFSYK